MNINSTFCLYFSGILFLFSCTNNNASKEKELRLLGTSLQESAASAELYTLSIMNDLTAKTYDPITKEKATVWLDKATAIRAACLEYVKETEKCRQLEKFDGEKLSKCFNNLNNELNAADSVFVIQFSKQIGSIESSLDSISKINSYINASKNSVDVMLRKNETDIALLETCLVLYCKNQIGYVDGEGSGFMTKTGILVGQNMNHLRKGNVLAISVGVGSFDSRARPQISIDGHKIKTESGQGEYRTKISDAPGKYKKHVYIMYTDVNGKQVTTKMNVEYIVDEN